MDFDLAAFLVTQIGINSKKIQGVFKKIQFKHRFKVKLDEDFESDEKI
jgi:hypothetical protein